MNQKDTIKRFRKLFSFYEKDPIYGAENKRRRLKIESFWIGEMEKAKKEGFKAGMKKILVSDIKEIDELKRILK